MGAKILTAFPKATIKLKVEFEASLSNEKRNLMIASMVRSCSRVISLHLIGFRFEDFQTFEGHDLSQVFPNVYELILNESYIPFEKLQSLMRIKRLSIWTPPKISLHAQSNLIKLPVLTTLEVKFDKIPQVRTSTFFFYRNDLHLNIDMGSVTKIQVRATEHSTFMVANLLDLSVTWKKVEILILDIYVQFSIEDIRTLLTNMPAVQKVAGIILRSNVTPKQFKNVVCGKFPNLQKLQWDYKTEQQRQKMIKFLSGIIKIMEMECGSIYTGLREKPFFGRAQPCP